MFLDSSDTIEKIDRQRKSVMSDRGLENRFTRRQAENQTNSFARYSPIARFRTSRMWFSSALMAS